MSKYLMDENPLIVLPRLAKKIGLNESLILQQIHYWLLKKLNAKEGYYWVYNTYKDWQEQFPFYSESTIKRAIKSLEDKELLIIGNFNKLIIDKTKWYRINYPKLKEIEDVEEFDGTVTTGQNDPTDRSKWSVEQVKMTRPLPEITTETTTNKKNNSKVKTSERATFSDDSQEMKLVKLFIKEMEKNSELFKQPANINNWCNDMRLILDIDLANKSKERVARCKIAQEAILHSCNKPYFSKNVRSISKLRGRFGEILDDLKETKSKQYPYNNNNTNQPQSKQQYIPIAENNLYGMGE